MSTIRGFAFENSSRIGYDDCDLSQQQLQNVENSNYMMATFKPRSNVDMVSFATSQPNVNFSGSNRIGISGDNIEVDSELTIRDLTSGKCRINLLERPYLTVPFLGRGKGNPMLESQLQQGDTSSNRKTVTNLSEFAVSDYTNTPLIPSVRNTVTNPANLIESEADDGWTRGGLPSREIYRDSKHY
jgi:hypothetical protein